MHPERQDEIPVVGLSLAVNLTMNDGGGYMQETNSRIERATAEDNQAPLSQVSQIPVSIIQALNDRDDFSRHAGNIRIKMLLPEKISC